MCQWKGIKSNIKNKSGYANAFLESVLPGVHKGYKSFSCESQSELCDLDYLPEDVVDYNPVVNQTARPKRKHNTVTVSSSHEKLFSRNPQRNISLNSHKCCPTLKQVTMSTFIGNIRSGESNLV